MQIDKFVLKCVCRYGTISIVENATGTSDVNIEFFVNPDIES